MADSIRVGNEIGFDFELSLAKPIQARKEDTS
jgi:hypothetical protein